MTAITSIKDGKQESAATADTLAAEIASDVATAAQPQTTLEWLAERWSGGKPFGAPRRSSSPEYATPPEPALSTIEARTKRRRRWMAHGSDRLCRQLAKVHGVQPAVTWGSLPANQKRVWETLHCDAVISRQSTASAAAGRTTPEKNDILSTSPGQSLAARGGGRVYSSGPESSEDDLSAEDECFEMAEAHRVVIGVAWGNLPEALKMRWNQLACDRMKEALLRRRQHPLRERTPVSLPAANPCLDMQRAHRVRVGMDWGTLPPSGRQEWTRLNCDSKVG